MKTGSSAGKRGESRLAFFLVAAIVLGIAGLMVVYPFIPADADVVRNPTTRAPIELVRSHVWKTPFHVLWALEGLRKIPFVGRLMFFGLVSALLFAGLKFGRTPVSLEQMREDLVPSKMIPRAGRRRVFLDTSVFLGAFAFLWLFRVNYGRNVLFGDGAMLPQEISRGVVHPAEVLTCHVFNFLHRLISVWSKNSAGLLAAQISSALAGACFVLCLLAYARTVELNRRERRILFCGLATTVAVVMFFGYVETTALELAALAFFLYAGANHLGQSVFRFRWFFWSLIGLSLVLLLHAGGILLLPALGFLLFEKGATPWRSLKKTLALPKIISAGLVLGVPYYLLIVRPFLSRGQFGNIGGGGDMIMFVPLSFPRASPPSRFVIYSMFSPWHLTDILSIVMLSSALAVPGSLFLVLRGWRLRLPPEGRRLRLFLLSTLATLAIPLLWNHDFGMWGDWNISATYLFPLNVLLYTGFVFINRKRRLIGLPVIAAVLSLQLFFTFSFYLQFR